MVNYLNLNFDFYYFILDHIIVIQPDGSFMNINNYNNITFVEDLASLSECIK